jgi:parallel beta-helix repeat protein
MIMSCLVVTERCETTGNHIYVKNTYLYNTGNGSANRPYRSIQKAIDLAQDGDTIYIFEGVYNESLQINKQLSIVGLDRKNTTISKNIDGYRYMIEITSDYVTLEDLNISDINGHIRTALLHITSDYVRLTGIRITQGKRWGVFLDHSNDNTIGYSTIDNMTETGIHAEYSNNNVLSSNKFNHIDGTCMDFSNTDSCIIFNNTIKNSSIGIKVNQGRNFNISNNTIRNCSLDAIHLFGGDNNVVRRNTIRDCNRYGLFVSSSMSTVFSNTFISNQVGIDLEGSNCQVTSNTIKSSLLVGLLANTGTSQNIISLNYFSKNAVNAQEKGRNSWYSQQRGNSWDTYNEGDRNLDGIGDRPYQIPGGGVDMYPLGVFLKPPAKPSRPSPADKKDEVGLSVTLNVTVVDPDSTYLSVYFYNGIDNALLGYQLGVPSSQKAVCSFTLPFQTTLSWYVVVNDSKLENRSDIWFFTTRKIPPLNQKPVADSGGPYSGRIGQVINMNGSGSRDPDGSIIFYRWNFGDGSSEILDRTPKHTYNDPGTYTVTLTVVDNSGRSEIANTTATISGDMYANVPPVPIIDAVSAVTVNQLVTFNASASYDIDGTIVGYRWDFNGDGTFETDWLTNATTTYTFATAGSVIVTLEVKDNANASFSTSITVNAVQKKTPGFDILLVLLAVLVGLLIYRKYR